MPSSDSLPLMMLSYTPKHLAEKILTSRSALEGERKQVTVMFADIKDSTELIGLPELSYATEDDDQALRYVEEGIKEAQATISQKYVVLGWALHGKIVAKLGDTDTFLQSALVQEIHENAARLGG